MALEIIMAILIAFVITEVAIISFLNLNREETSYCEETSSKEAISSVEDAQRKKNEFYNNILLQEKIDQLINDISDEIISLERDTTPELQEVNKVFITEMKKLLQEKIESEEDYKFIVWKYNNGFLRTQDEISNYYKYKINQEYLQSGQYDRDRHSNNLLAYICPFILTFSLVMTLLYKKINLFALPFALMAALIAAIIGSIISYSDNIKTAKMLNIPDSYTGVREERLKRTTAFVGLGAATIKGAKDTKKHIKNIMK